MLCSAVQKHLDDVIEWTSKWGFLLSKTKTTAVLFTRAKEVKQLEAQVKLTIQGTLVQLAQQVKFLGVTYDQRLTWKPHITSLVDQGPLQPHAQRQRATLGRQQESATNALQGPRTLEARLRV